MQWFGPNQAAFVYGRTLPGGMFYIGRGLRAPQGIVEPALIDPTLRVNFSRPDLTGRSMGYWPAYGDISPAARAAYLDWLADGRRAPDTYIGYVFLFLYGLERRVLADIAADPSLSWELPLIGDEVRRLLGLYGDNGSFRGYAGQFAEVIDLVLAAHTSPERPTPPPLGRRTWPQPVSLWVELGAFAADRTPVPAEWALAWAWYHPDVYPRTPASRCPEEFAALFKRRYTDKHGDGIVVRPAKHAVKLSYYTASAGIGTADLSMDHIPDVIDSPSVGRQLAAIVDSVTNDLDAYSRWLGRNPEGRGSLAAAALLPDALLEQPAGDVQDFRDWVTATLTGTDTAVISGRELLRRWPTASAEKMSKAETVSLAQLLGHFGVGIEPDVRLGGKPITADANVVLFATGPDSAHAPTPTYTAATTLLHLAAAVSAADGHVSEDEHEHLVAHLETSLQLTAGERTRLHAHLRWLTASEVKLTGLRKRLDALSTKERAAIGDTLIMVAAADGVISPEEVSSLIKIYKLLGLDPETVTSRLHATVTGVARPAPADGPVTVRAAGPAPTGYPIPPPPAERAPESVEAGTEAVPGHLVALDLATIETKLAETAHVGALLGSIFAQDEENDAGRAAATSAVHASADGGEPAAAPQPVASDAPVAGLGAAYSALLRDLGARPTWSRSEYEDLAHRYAVMPDGAVDVLNEAAIEATDEPVLEGDDELEVNTYALQELLR